MNRAKETITAKGKDDEAELVEIKSCLKGLQKVNKQLETELAVTRRILSEVPPQLSPDKNEYHADLHERITQELAG